MMIKVCGITRREDAEAAVHAGASAIGFIFYPKSPRYVTPEAAAALGQGLNTWKVGIFVDQPATAVEAVARAARLDVVQIYGGETPTSTKVWRAFRVKDGIDPKLAAQADAVLLDGPANGTGFDWKEARGVAEKVIVAGGLNASNVAEAIRVARPWGVDASSGLETAPGIKDHDKIRRFHNGREGGRAVTPTQQPDATGHFGPYGGRFVPEVLMAPLEELELAYRAAKEDPSFQAELDNLLHRRGGPTPLYFCKRLSETLGGAKIYLKREDLLHTGAHKINNCLGQALLARRMGKKRIIAETGAGQHGVATATVCSLFGLECVVYMGEEDMRRQRLNVFRMRLLGATVVSVKNGSRTLKDAISEAMRDWVTNVHTTHYLLGSALGAHPYPMMVRDFHRCIGLEARADILKAEGRLPDSIIACVGGGSNAIGIFHAFLNDPVKLIGVEAGGRSLKLGEHAARFEGGSPGVLHGAYTYMLQDADGQAAITHSVSAGLDYVLIGPEHALLHDEHRAEYTSCTDTDALAAAQKLARTEGIIPALESSHAVAEAIHRAPSEPGKVYIVNLSGRGDKDTDIYRENIPELDLP